MSIDVCYLLKDCHAFVKSKGRCPDHILLPGGKKRRFIIYGGMIEFEGYRDSVWSRMN